LDARQRFAAGTRPHFAGYDEIIDACCDAWRRLEAEAGRIQSIATRSWVSIGHG